MINISIALPDSSLSDEQTKRDKSVKVGQFARAFSIFKVRMVYIYHDPFSRFDSGDARLLRILLEYLNTPQYLRKVAYPKMHELEYAGILHPIKAPHHKPREDVRQIKVGDVRSGLLTKLGESMYANVGLERPIPFEGRGSVGKQVNALFTSQYPNLRAREAKESEISPYWGYRVKEISSLSKFLSEQEQTIILLTSRKGHDFREIKAKLLDRLNAIQKLLVLFGSPRNSVQDILIKERGKMSLGQDSLIANMFPGQATETVRLEEAILGTLAILNLFN